MCDGEHKIWSRGASTRYLWKPRHVEAAVDYVMYCQEDVPFEFRDWSGLNVKPLLTRGLLHWYKLMLFGNAKKVVDDILTAMRA